MPDVYRTLVIGMGSSGAHVLNEIIDMVNWQYGGLKNTPWIKMHCFDTDPGSRHNIPATCFTHLQLDAHEYADTIQKCEKGNIETYYNWLDPSTLRELPAASVLVGAGGLRMAGRLTFFKRYQTIKSIVSENLHQLDTILGGNIDDTSYSVMDQIRVFVVGSLCGGTCSGSVADIGFLIQMTMKSIITKCLTSGIFTIPYPDAAKLENIQSKKANAITAIKELHSYSMSVGIGGTKSSWGYTFPDGSRVDEEYTPYNLIYLVRPEQNTETEVHKMHQNIAERIFLNIFEPDIDTLALSVDVDGPPFSTFGLSSLMYPAHQIADACASYAEYSYISLLLRDTPPNDAVRTPEILTPLGARVAINNLFNKEVNLSNIKAIEGVEKCVQKLTSAEAQIDDVRRRFMNDVWAALISTLTEYIDNVDAGFARWRALLNQLLSDETGINNLKVKGYRPDWADPDLHPATTVNGCFNPFKLKNKTPNSIAPKTLALITGNIEQHQNYLAALVLNDNTINQIRAWITPLRNNCLNTVDFLRVWRVETDNNWTNKSTTSPILSGEALFVPSNTTGDGTAWDVMRQVYYRHRTMHAANIVNDILQLTTPLVANAISRWLINGNIASATGGTGTRFSTPIPHMNQPEDIIDKKKETHLPIAQFFINQSSVFEIWGQMSDGDKALYASKVAKASNVMLDIRDHGIIDAPGLYYHPLIRDKDADDVVVKQFHVAASHNMPLGVPGADIKSSNPNRAVLLQEILKFHPTALTMLPNYIEAGSGAGHLTMRQSRNDVVWLGLTAEEMKKDMIAFETLSISLLLGIIKINGGYLEYRPGTTRIEDLNKRVLPQNLYYASRLLALAAAGNPSYDVNKQPLNGMGLEWLNQRILDQLTFHDGDASLLWRNIEDAINNGIGGELMCWASPIEYKSIMYGFAKSFMIHSKNPNMRKVGCSKLEPPASEKYWLNEGEKTVRHTTALRSGYYCSICGGPVGATKDEAADNGWSCTFNPSHKFGIVE